jgi:hypothetical protein
VETLLGILLVVLVFGGALWARFGALLNRQHPRQQPPTETEKKASK